MAKKEQKAAPAKEAKKKNNLPVAGKKKTMTADEKAAKKAARKEALKNRPAGQRGNSKQIDIIELESGAKVLTFGYPVVAKRKHIGVLTTSVIVDESGAPVGVSQNFVEGNLTIKVKKGHGVITAPKAKGQEDVDEDVEENDEDVEENEADEDED